VYQRLFFGHVELSSDLASTLVRQIMAGIATEPGQEP